MNSQQVKDTSLAYLKVVIHLLNDNMEELDFKMGRLLRLDDLDNLTSLQIMKIVTFLLRDVVGDKPISKTVALSNFNKFGIGMVFYDCGIDHIYHAVKQIFPEDDDLFHYSVLLLPSLNPKRTKAAISYIMSFVLMCSKLEEKFITCYDTVIKENDDKAEICREIDELKDRQSCRIQERETDKERLPSLQKELQVLEDNVQKQQNVLAKFNAEVQKHKTVYEIKEAEIKNMELELERLNMERLHLERQLVSNPEDIRAENEGIRKQLEVELKSREAIGADLKKCANECDVLESVIQRAHHVIQCIESVISLMEDAKTKIEFYMKTVNESNLSSREIDLRKQEIQKLSDNHGEKLAEVNKTKDEYELRIQELHDEISSTNLQTEHTKNEIQHIFKAQRDVNVAIEKINSNIEVAKNEIAKSNQYIHEVLPRQTALHISEAQKLLKDITFQFNSFPALKLKDAKAKKYAKSKSHQQKD